MPFTHEFDGHTFPHEPYPKPGFEFRHELGERVGERLGENDGGGLASFYLLPHLHGNRHHRLPGEWGDSGEGPSYRQPCRLSYNYKALLIFMAGYAIICHD